MVFRKRRRITPQVNITSLIDVVLQLLIFFMITTTFVTQPGIPINLPKASAKVNNVTQESHTVLITADNTIFMNRQEIHNIEELRSMLLKLHQDQQGELIVVKADESVAHGVVVGVMDIIKTSGFTRIAIATR